MNLIKTIKNFFLFKSSPKRNKDVTYGSELEIYDANIVYTNRYQNYNLSNNDSLNDIMVKFLSNIVIEFSLNPDTVYCKEFFKFLNMLSIGNIRYSIIRKRGILLLYVAVNIYDLESLLCANIESSNVLIETIVMLLDTLPVKGFSRVISKNIIQESDFAYANNYNYDGLEILKPYKDFQTAVNRYNPSNIVEIIEIDHLEYALEKYEEVTAIKLSNIIFITHVDLDILGGYKFEIKQENDYKLYVYCMSIDDFNDEIKASFLFNKNTHVYAKLLTIIHDENIGNYFNKNRNKDDINIFNIKPINLERVNNYRDYVEYDYDDDSEDENSPGETSDYEYQNFYDGIDEVLSEEDIKEAEEYTAKINKQNE